MPPYTVVMDTLNEVENQPYSIGRPNLDGDDTIWYLNASDTWVGYRFSGATSFPNLVAEGGKVYMLYTSTLEYPFMFTESKYYRGVFATVSHNNGLTWDDQESVSWLSYHPDLYYIDWVSTELYGELMTMNEAECMWPVMAPNSANGNLFMMWYADYIPGSVGGMAQSSMTVFGYKIPKEDIGFFNNCTEVYQNLWNIGDGIKENTLSEMKIYPNPASNNVTIHLLSKETANATIVITGITGQKVYSQNISLETGNNQFQLNVSNYPAGFYLVNIRTNTGSTTQKLIIR